MQEGSGITASYTARLFASVSANCYTHIKRANNMTTKFKKTGNRLDDSDQINKIIDEAIDAFSDDHIKEGVEALRELAHLFKSAGTDSQSFADLAKYIENEAVERTGDTFLRFRISVAIRDINAGRIIVGAH